MFMYFGATDSRRLCCQTDNKLACENERVFLPVKSQTGNVNYLDDACDVIGGEVSDERTRTFGSQACYLITPNK